MTTLPRLLLGALVTLALSSAPALAESASPARADNPSVAYKRIVKECSTYTMDGQKQKQCRADFTTAVTGIKKDYKIAVLVQDPGSDTTYAVGTFTSKGARASKRLRDAVVSYGVPDDQTRLRFHVVVRNADGEKVWPSQRRAL